MIVQFSWTEEIWIKYSAPASGMKHIINKKQVVQIKELRNMHCPKTRNKNF